MKNNPGYTVKEVAFELELSVSRVIKAIKDLELEEQGLARKWGNEWSLDPEVLLLIAKRKGKVGNPEINAQRPGMTAYPQPPGKPRNRQKRAKTSFKVK